jgi:AmmeMemoRadiSam system protein B
VPSGDVPIDEELAAAMLDEGRARRCLVEQPSAHSGDHAIEVQLPFLIEMLSGTRFVPVAMPHTEDGPAAGEATARAVKRLGRRAVALASTDLTHYGANYYGWAPKGNGREAHRWSKDVNDRRYIDHLVALDAQGAYAAGEADGSACGPAAGAAAAAFAKAFGATKGVLLEHITSWERAKCEGEPTDFVGYAAMVFI